MLEFWISPLLISLIPLFLAPILHYLCQKRTSWLHGLDGFIFVAIGGLILTGILPELLYHGGWKSLLFLFLGLISPLITERILHVVGKVHTVALLLGLVGLFLHAITDGAALAHGDHGDHAEDILTLGVLLHRIPIGLTIWWFARPKFGKAAALGLLTLVGMGTVVGYSSAEAVLEPLNSAGMAYFQAFVAGSLIHIVFHRPHAGDSCSHTHGSNWAEGLGNLIGGAVVLYIAMDHAHLSELPWFQEVGHTFVDLTLESAPALLLAYVLAGLATAFMPQSYVDWMSANRSWKQSVRGVVVGLPLPVCSCGVVPLYHTLIKKGAPPTAAMAFMIATPELGIDAVLISIPLLGETMTGLRIVAAALVALLVGIIVGRLTPKIQKEEMVDAHTHGSQPSEFKAKLKYGLTHGLGELVDHTGPWILVGLVVASLLQPVLGSGLLSGIPGGLEVPLFALLGMPLYVCASGATPMIAVFLMNGVSPGAALAFLITGPATNITTFGVLSKLHNRRIATLFGATTLVITVILGYVVDAIFTQFQPVSLDADHVHGTPFHMVALALLTLIFSYSLFRRGARAFFSELGQGSHDHHHDHHHGHGHDHHHHHDCDHHDHDHRNGHDHHHNHDHDHDCDHPHHDHDHGHDHDHDHGHHHRN